VTPIVAEATDRLFARVDELPDEAWSADSGCTGWTRGHVIAHLTLNAEGLGGALRGLIEGVPIPMYASNERRDSDIDALAAAPSAQIRPRLRSAADALAGALAVLHTLPEEATFERTPGGVRLPAHVVPLLRLREVEIHHADLRAGYSYADWPTDTAIRLLEHDAGRYDGPPLLARDNELDVTFAFGAVDRASPVVTGPVAALAWWASGRDPGAVLTSSNGSLPNMEGR
jgi:maleylpyruvate isomerase